MMRYPQSKYSLCCFRKRLAVVPILFLLFHAFPAAVFAQTAEISAGEEALWREHGFNRPEAGEWKYYGIGPRDAREWVRSGIIYPGWANQWKGEGFSPQEARKWKDMTNVYTAGKFFRYGFSAEEAKSWMDSGVQSALRAKEYREAGMSAEQGGEFWRLGLYPEDVKAWWKAGFSPQETLAWRYGPKDVAYFHTAESPSSQRIYPLKWAIDWKNAGFNPEEARDAGSFRIPLEEALAWRKAGFAFNDMVAWRDSGFDIPGALRNGNAGLGAVEAEKKRDSETENAEDEITSLHCDITLRENGQIDVVQTQEIVNRTGGIYGSTFHVPLPLGITLRHRQSSIREARPAYEIHDTRIDGLKAAHSMSGGTLHVGDQTLPLTRGTHTVRISYTTDDRLITLPDHDELFFEVINNSEKLKIGRASATVRLPKGAQIIFADGQAGLPGRKDLAVKVRETEWGDVAAFEATRPLKQNMLFRLSVAFLKGYVDPGMVRRLGAMDRRSGHALSSFAIFLSGWLALIAYYSLTWRRVGRDPRRDLKRDTQLIEYEAPNDVGPAEARQLYKKGRVDDVSIIATILHLAVCGHIRISERQGGFRMERTGPDHRGCTAAEEGFLEKLFAGTHILVMGHARARKAIGDAGRYLKSVLRTRFKDLLVSNRGYLWPGIAAMVVTVLLSMAVLDVNDYGKGKLFKNIYLCFMILMFGGTGLIFRQLLKSPTEAYLKLLNRIKGYRLYLASSFGASAGKGGVLPPSLHRHLPYAMALGIDCRGVMIRQGEADWHSGRSGIFGIGDFSDSIRRRGKRVEAIEEGK